MTFKFLSFLPIVLWFSSSNTFAQDNRDPTATELYRIALQQDQFGEMASRESFVTAAENYCDAIQKAFPTNSPSEEKWLSDEISKGSGSRLIRTFETPEFARRRALEFTTACLTYARVFQSGNSQLGLSGLVYAFTRFEGDAEFYSRKAGVDGDRFSIGALSIVAESLALAALANAAEKLGYKE